MSLDRTYTPSGVYVIHCDHNGKSYIGSTCNLQSRKAEHFRLLKQNKHPNRYLQFAWNKYGLDCFRFFILKRCYIEDLLTEEQIYIDRYRAYGNGFNLRPRAASNLGWKQSEEQKRNNSICHKGWKMPEESKLALSKALTGRCFSDAHRMHLSIALQGKKLSSITRQKISEAQIGRISNRKGVKLSEETRRKISEAQIGKKLSEEHKMKLRNRRHSEEEKQRISEANIIRWSKLSIEQRSKIGQKILSKSTHEQISQRAYHGWETRRMNQCVV